MKKISWPVFQQRVLHKPLYTTIITAIVLIIGIAVLWQVNRYFSPDSGVRTNGSATAQLKAADHSTAGPTDPLTCSPSSSQTPDYQSNDVTQLSKSGGTITMPCFQGTLDYQ